MSAKAKGDQHLEYLKSEEIKTVKTKWRIMIYVHEKETNGDGLRGKGARKKVAGYDFIFYKEMWETSKVIQKGAKMVALTKTDWIKWQCDNVSNMTEPIAMSLWEKAEKDRAAISRTRVFVLFSVACSIYIYIYIYIYMYIYIYIDFSCLLWINH